MSDTLQTELEELKEYQAWLRFLQEPDTVDKSEFCGLLKLPQVTPQAVFSQLPHGDALATGVREFMARTQYKGWYFLPDPVHRADPARLLALAKAQADEYTVWLRDNGEPELANEVRAAEPLWIEDKNTYNEMTAPSLSSDAYWPPADAFVATYLDADRRYGGAREMILFLSMEPFVTNHLLTRAVPFGLSWQAGYELYLAGGRMAFLSDRIAVSYI